MATANTTAIFIICMIGLLSGCDNHSSSNQYRTITDVATPAPDPVESPSDDAPVETVDGFAIVGYFPQINDQNIALVSGVTITFNEPILEGSYNRDLVQVTHNGSLVGGVLEKKNSTTLHFNPEALLQPNTTYQVTIDDQIMSQTGQTPTTLNWQFTTAADVYTTPQNVIDQCMSELDIEMLAAVNTARVVNRACGEDAMASVGKLRWNCDLQVAAINHAMDMTAHDFFSHTGSDGSSIGDRATRAGYEWSYVGENLAAGQNSVTEVMTGLLNSPGHCRNIMSPHYAEFGFGYSVNNDTVYKRYWAQAFARPF